MFNVVNGSIILTVDSDDQRPIVLPLPITTENSTNNIIDFISDNVGPDTTVYVDMDNTIADFNKALAGLFAYTNARDIVATTEEKVATISAAMPGFFLNLEKLPQAEYLLSKLGNYKILTTDTGLLNGNGEKVDWVTNNLITYPPTGDVLFALNFNKGSYANSTSVLIDDSPTYVKQFKDAGGEAFRYIWSEIVAGSLPPGFSLVNNEIVGTPISQNTTTTSTFTVRVHDNEGYFERELAITVNADPNYNAWQVQSPYDLGRFIERTQTNILLPIDQTDSPTVAVIAGELPPGYRLEGYNIIGSAFEVARLKTFDFVIRATVNNTIADRKFSITIEGEDAPQWVTPAGDLNIGSTFSESFWIDEVNSEYGIYSTINYITYTVTVAPGTNSYGTGNKYYIDGVLSPALTLREGSTYRFDLSDASVETHGLRFSVTPNGIWGAEQVGEEYTEGVKVVGTAGNVGAYVEISVPRNAPNLHYYCINHSGMGNSAITSKPTSYTKQNVTTSNGVPSNSTGNDGDYIFDTINNIFYVKYNGIYKLVNQSQLRSLYGNTTRLEVSTTIPNPLEVDFWFNINPDNQGLKFKIANFNSSKLLWQPNNYKLSKTAPIDPEDKDLWIQYFDNDTKIILRYYDKDELQWIPLPYTSSNVPPERASNAFFVIDNSKVEFQLEAIDPDLTAGDTLKYYIQDGDGELPPGLTLSSSGKIAGIVDPILALDSDNYDPYGDSTRQQQGVTDTEGYDSFSFDTQFYGFGLPSRNPRKLNREYEFFITVADDVSESKRRFSIYVVSDDFLRADNTIMRSATGLFTADVTYLRRPIWLTRGDLGSIRADNYNTIFIEVYDPNYLLGNINYNLLNYNDDGTPSVVPDGLEFDSSTGELAGIVPYQPAVEKEYKFTIEATRSEADQEIFEVNTNILEDTLAGAEVLKVRKISRDMSDGIDDVVALIDTAVTIENNDYLILNINEDESDDYDVLEFAYPLLPSPNFKALTLFKEIQAGDSFAIAYKNNLTETDIAKWVGRNIRYASTNNVVDKIEFINNYRFIGESNQMLGVNHLAAGISITPGEPIQTTIKRALSQVTGIAQDLIIVDATDLTSIVVNIPQTASSNNRNLLESVFDTEDSAPVESVVDDETIKVTFTGNWSVNVLKDTQFAIGAVKDKNIKKRLTESKTEFTSTSKTFTIKVLGNVESTIQWITPEVLPNLGANRISYLKVQAQTTLAGANLRYDFISGKLPQGLELKPNGEIVGTTSQFGTASSPGLTTLDNRATTFDGATTTFDRDFKFKVLARDRFGYSAVSRNFTLKIDDTDNKLYSNVFMQPFLINNQREIYENFINDYTIFTPNLIYRPYDNNFGLQKNLRTLAFAGIEQKSIADFASAVRQNHKKKKFKFGEVKTAIAKQPGTNDIVYEVVYIEIIDPGKPKNGDTVSRAKIRTGTELKINQVKLESKDDDTAKSQGVGFFNIVTRSGTPVKVQEQTTGLIIQTRAGTDVTIPTSGAITIITRIGSLTILTTSLTTDSSGDPFRFRPKGDVITVDQTAVFASQGLDQYRYISNIGTMRKRIKAIGANEREFLPLWMRTAQEGSLAEIDYVTALPLCYTTPGGSQIIKENITNANFDFKQINYEIDRYIVDKTSDSDQETFILFPNHTYNET
tara:strand:+ start:2503 stop:7440 length:4938 start_codon:yes stop_codon:yes gene_type:complete